MLDALPRNETFDWVQHVSIKLTTMMLATLFDFPVRGTPQADLLVRCFDLDVNAGGVVHSEEKRLELLTECLETMGTLFYERQKRQPQPDLLSMLAHGEATRNLPENPSDFLGNLVLLIVGGNDTTRNSMSGGVLGTESVSRTSTGSCGQIPALIPSAVSEIIRWQSPVVHMRRTATADGTIGGKQIREGDKVCMWYVSGNRDEDAIERPDEFMVDRARPRQHLSFGFGIHRCVGNRLAELQIYILWEEISWRGIPVVELMDEPTRIYSNFIHGISALPVRIAG